jgi:pimeloyl-ACP methyl ester carboxylesterase
MWDGVAPTLADAGFPVVAPDLPGEDVELGFPTWAERVLGLLEGPFAPVGSSMGGYLAFELWRRAPERVAAALRRGRRPGGRHSCP